MTDVSLDTLAPFVYDSLPSRVTFGSGAIEHVSAEVHRLGISRALILHGSPHNKIAEDIAEKLEDRHVCTYGGAQMHTPVAVTEEALELVHALKVDGIIAIGGGSTTGLSKAIALRTDLPQVVLPTTYAGSEMTPILGETQDGIKVTQRSHKVLPESVIYDVDLTLDLPVGISGVSGMNAIAHSVEALYAKDANPVISALAIESIRALVRALPVIRSEPKNVAARSQALYGAWLAGMCLGSVGMALHHKLCHTLGGSFNLPHAETHAVILPHALAYNAPSIPEVMERLSRALQVPDAARALYEVNIAVGAPTSLAVIGMPEEGVEKAVELTLSNAYWNPRPLERQALRELLNRAHLGLPPQSASDATDA